MRNREYPALLVAEPEGGYTARFGAPTPRKPEKGRKMVELKKLRQEAIKSGNFVALANGDRLVALPLVVPGKKRRVYLGEHDDLYYRRGERYYRFGRLENVEQLGLVHSPLRSQTEKRLPRNVDNVFKFFRIADTGLNPTVWQDALGYLQKLEAAVGIEGNPGYIYRFLSEKGWREDYPLPDSLWSGANLKEPWTTLRNLTGGVWGSEEDLKKLAREVTENGETWVAPPSLKYNVKVGFRSVPGLPGYETSVLAEYRGLAHGHYGLLVNRRGAVFLAESD